MRARQQCTCYVLFKIRIGKMASVRPRAPALTLRVGQGMCPSQLDPPLESLILRSPPPRRVPVRSYCFSELSFAPFRRLFLCPSRAFDKSLTTKIGLVCKYLINSFPPAENGTQRQFLRLPLQEKALQLSNTQRHSEWDLLVIHD